MLEEKAALVVMEAQEKPFIQAVTTGLSQEVEEVAAAQELRLVLTTVKEAEKLSGILVRVMATQAKQDFLDLLEHWVQLDKELSELCRYL